MHSGTGLKGLVRVAAGVLACLVVAGVPAVMAADGAANGQSAAAPPASPQSTAVVAAPADGGAPATTDDAPAPDFLHSIEVYGFVDGYYGWAFNETESAAPQLRRQPQQLQPELRRARPGQAGHRQDRAGFRVDFGAGDTADLVNSLEPGGTGYLSLRPAGACVGSGAGRQGRPDGGLRQVRHPGRRRSDREQGQLQLLARAAVRARHSLLPHGRARVGYSFSDKVSVTGYLVNGWNDVKRQQRR